MKARAHHGMLVEEAGHAIPFSRGILARSIAEVGFDIYHAYRIAENILVRLRRENRRRVPSHEIRDMALREIQKIDPRAAQRYEFWREEQERRRRGETVILIGGSSGVGTTTIAYQVAARLNINNVVSTDIIREIMRMMISEKLNPELHQSTFNAYERTHLPVPREYDKVVYGFERQASLVSVGVEAVINRALKEGHNLVVEGVHLVPGYIDRELVDRKQTLAFLLVIDDEHEHRQRFSLRSAETDLKRTAEYYLAYFQEIRKTQEYLSERARQYGFQVIENLDVDHTVELIMEEIFKSYTTLEAGGGS
ncbi:MAG: AAA family ATPase [Spirochaetota bacterium]